jgi:predicted CXXCH cytochrome family protein
MRRFNPSQRTDQESEYWTSGHGQRLRENGDPQVATCVSCHGHHNILPVKDLQSPVFPTRVAETCATCHADKDKMAGRSYHGRPLGHEQFEKWRASVHAQALFEEHDFAAPTCNDCHGNHGALPPEIGSVANACGSCHVKIAELFSNTLMKHRFESVELPGCSACHQYHDIRTPDDAMLGMGSESVCAKCHENGQFGATLAGAEVAESMRGQLTRLKQQIHRADARLQEATRLGMEVRSARFRLRDALDALTEARSQVHTFALSPLEDVINQGLQVSDEVEQAAERAFQEHQRRRVWLAISVLPILLVVGLLLLCIRRLTPID